MMTENQLKITSTLHEDYSTKINLDGETYLIDSEDLGIQKGTVMTRVFHKGKIIYSREIDYKDILNMPDSDIKLKELRKKQQQLAVQALRKEKTAHKKLYKDYLREVESLIRSNEHKEAFQVLDNALKNYSNNPIILSYKGFLEAVVNKNFCQGEMICREAIVMIKEEMPLCETFFLPILYLNLGKVFLAANNRQDAYDYFKKGLEVDSTNEHLLGEIKKLGIHGKPPLPFLQRSNLLNKYLGKLLHKLKE